MSRTDKDRPYDVQRHDKTLNIVEDHDHSHGECDFYILEAWKRRFNDKTHKISGLGARGLSFRCCIRPRTTYEFYKLIGRNPEYVGKREQFKRGQRRKVNVLCQQGIKGGEDFYSQFDDDIQLTQLWPRKAYRVTATYRKPKRPYVSKRRARSMPEPTVAFEEWQQSPYAYYRKHRMNIKSMHGKRSKAL